MPQSIAAVYLHIVWSTKHRFPFIIPEVEAGLHAYLGKVCKEHGCPAIQVGGWVDHVHVLCMLSRNIAMRDLMENLKSHSSKWMKSQHPDCRDFYWQTGYAAFSLSHHDIPRIQRYIRNQHAHHQGQSFQDELRKLHIESNTEFDERYAWD